MTKKLEKTANLLVIQRVFCIFSLYFSNGLYKDFKNSRITKNKIILIILRYFSNRKKVCQKLSSIFYRGMLTTTFSTVETRLGVRIDTRF